jgi:HAD superfamily hydrolase (TIGR01509 family)
MSQFVHGTRALIFDFDGLILDTEVAIYEAWREIYSSHGHPLTMETWAQCVGSDFGHYDPMADLERMLEKKLDWEPITHQRRHRVNSILHGKEEMPGVRARLLEAKALGISCAVASSSSHDWVDGWLGRLGLADLFSSTTCLEDVGKAKPDPGLFLHAAGKLGAKPEEIIVFEDSLNGLRAARAAHMRCVVVPCDLTRHLTFEGAWRQYRSLEEVKIADLTGCQA